MQIRKIPKEKFLGLFGGDDYELRILNRSVEGLPESEKKLFRLIDCSGFSSHNQISSLAQ